MVTGREPKSLVLMPASVSLIAQLPTSLCIDCWLAELCPLASHQPTNRKVDYWICLGGQDGSAL